MKVSKETTEILNNFSKINKNFLFTEGSTLQTLNSSKSMLVEAKISELIPSRAGVVDLTKILDCLKSFNDSELFFNENSVKVANDYSEATFGLFPEEQIPHLKKAVSFDPSGVSFTLNWLTLSEIIRYSNLMGVKISQTSNSRTFDSVSFSGNGELMTVQVQESRTVQNETLKISLGESDRKFNFSLQAKELVFIEDEYLCEVSNTKTIRFTGKNKPITYYLATLDCTVEE